MWTYWKKPNCSMSSLAFFEVIKMINKMINLKVINYKNRINSFLAIYFAKKQYISKIKLLF